MNTCTGKCVVFFEIELQNNNLTRFFSNKSIKFGMELKIKPNFLA